MKNLFLIALFCGGLLVPAMAQDRVPPPPESKPDKELECDEADARIQKYKEQNATLQSKVDGLKADVKKAEGDLATAVSDLKKCNDDIYSMIGASEADVNSFRERLGRIEGKVREMQRLNDDQLADRQDEVKALEAELNALRGERVAALPEFYDRVIALARDIKGLYREKKIKGYTVGTWAENRDCLWNISGRAEIYGDPFQWPKIWQANTDQIKNPDIIQPGWVLTIPPAGPKTDEEMKAERKYWRKKRAAAEAAAASTNAAPGTSATNTTTKTEAGN
jgi:septal ring factor EnvC (AmiA/AmiB activator)